MKTWGVAAIMMISCFAMVCAAPVGDADSQNPSNEGQWGFMKEIDGIQTVIDLMKESQPEFLFESVDDLEMKLKAMASFQGMDPKDVIIDLDLRAGIYVIGEKVNANTMTTTVAATVEIPLDLKLPVNLVKMLFDGAGGDSDDDFFYLHDTVIELQTVAEIDVTLNDDGFVTSVLSNTEGVVHIGGSTNLTCVDGVYTCTEEADNVVDHLLVFTMSDYIGYGSEGYKFLPEGDETRWTNNIDGEIVRIGTIHNESKGSSLDLLDLFEKMMSDDAMNINPETYSGPVVYEAGSEDIDVTLTLTPGVGGGDPYVTIHYNNGGDDVKMPLAFYEGFGFIQNLGPLMPFLAGTDVQLTPEQTMVIREKTSAADSSIADLTDGIVLDVYYLADEEDMYNQTPLHKETVGYGGTVSATFKPQAPEGRVFIEWAVGGTDHETYMEDMAVHSDLYLIPVYATVIHNTPTQQDFNLNEVFVWECDASDTKLIDWNLLKDNTGRDVFVVVKDGDRPLYKWSITTNGEETGTGAIDLGIESVDVPQGIADRFSGKKVTYLDFNASGKMPDKTLVSYNVSGSYDSESPVDIYHDGGNGLEYMGQSAIVDGHVVLDIESCSGYVLVGNAAPGGGAGPGMDIGIIAAIVGVCIVGVVAVLLIKRRG